MELIDLTAPIPFYPVSIFIPPGTYWVIPVLVASFYAQGANPYVELRATRILMFNGPSAEEREGFKWN
jgi:hypothetical protein